MASIHHATAKKAAAENIAITEQGGAFVATLPTGRFAVALKASDALADAIALRRIVTEYRGFHAEQADGQHEKVWTVSDNDGDQVGFAPRLADALADAISEAEETGYDYSEGPEGDDEAEIEGGRVIVAPKYRAAYAERGNPNHCGDWLAGMLDGQFVVADPETGTPYFDTSAFTACLVENGVELSGKWAALPQSGQKGWVGRYRMNGRQRLERRVAEVGQLIVRGETYRVPENDLVLLWNRHPEAETIYEEGRKR